MKRIISILVVALLALPAFTQELSKKEKRQLEKELKKEMQAEELAQKAGMVTAMVTYGRFVLEANTLRDKRGNSAIVSSDLNFVAADSTTGVIQIGQNAYVGRNGVGGITVEGSISDYSFTMHEKSGSYNISYYLRTPAGTYDVRIVAYPDSRAEATVSSATWGGRIVYSGYFVPPGISRVYKGMAL